MKIKFKTKVNINGNYFVLNLDTEKKEIDKNNYFSSSDIELSITRSELKEIENIAIEKGYKKV